MKLKKIAVLVAIVGLSTPAFATNGYFCHGYGLKAKGMGGAATAMSIGAFGGANNPASMVWAGDRLDVGVDLFSPKRKSERTGSGAMAIDGEVDSDSNLFLVPEFGYNKMMGWVMSAGITVYGNGGMNTNYESGQIPVASACQGFNPGTTTYNMLCGTGSLGINMMQLVIAPTFAMKVNKNHSFGASVLLGYQKFAARGLHGFAGFTPSMTTARLTNRGYDDSTGWGLRLGYMGKLSDTVTVGAAYSTEIKMKKFSKYKELCAEQGDFDMPANFNLGIAWKATPGLTIAADYQRIDYDGVKSVSNPSTNTGASTVFTGFTVGSLGCDSCRGFGWQSIDVWKLGVEYVYSPKLTLRAGWNHGENPIKDRDVTFKILAPGVVKNHITLGFTYNLTKDSELTMSYMHAQQESVKGGSLFNNWLPAGNEKIQMYQNSLGIAYGLKFQ